MSWAAILMMSISYLGISALTIFSIYKTIHSDKSEDNDIGDVPSLKEK